MSTPPRTRIMLDGQRFGRLLVLEEAPRRAQHRYWRCRCDCGTETIVAQTVLRTGRTQSCGCLQRERLAARSRTHGATGTPEFKVWRSMRQRCTNPRDSIYRYYGARGIRVCPEWEAFETFLQDMGTRPSYQHCLLRLDEARDYEPGNCRWVTETERRRIKGWRVREEPPTCAVMLERALAVELGIGPFATSTDDDKAPPAVSESVT